jgi:hypothetical protein
MSDTFIHNIRISYDESDERVRDFVGYLKDEKRKEEMKKYYGEARQNNKIYINDSFNNEFTLTYVGNYNCSLGLRGM